MIRSLLAIFGLLIGLVCVEAFAPMPQGFRQVKAPSIVSLQAAAGKKKKKRRRKQPPVGTSSTQSVAKEAPVAAKETTAPAPKIDMEKVIVAEEVDAMIESPSPEDVKVDKTVIADVASFKFEPDDAITKGT